MAGERSRLQSRDLLRKVESWSPDGDNREQRPEWGESKPPALPRQGILVRHTGEGSGPEASVAWHAQGSQARPGVGGSSNAGSLLSCTLCPAPRPHSVMVHRNQPHGTNCREHVANRLGREGANS